MKLFCVPNIMIIRYCVGYILLVTRNISFWDIFDLFMPLADGNTKIFQKPENLLYGSWTDTCVPNIIYWIFCLQLIAADTFACLLGHFGPFSWPVYPRARLKQISAREYKFTFVYRILYILDVCSLVIAGHKQTGGPTERWTYVK